MSQRLFLLAGEKSGDLLGSYLIQSLLEELPNCSLEGVGGPEMRSYPFDSILRVEDFEVMGFSDVLASLPKLWRQFHALRRHILETNPDAVIFIDYPGFNLRMARSLRKKGYQGKLIQYVSPTVWAWDKDRIAQMTETLDLLLTIYPFEKSYFQNSPLPVIYVGHPIKQIVHNHVYQDQWASLFRIADPKNLIAIFPGSRRSEIELNLPYQLKAALLLKKTRPSLQFAISCAHEKVMPVMHELLKEIPLQLDRDLFFLPKAYSYELMRDAGAAMAKSGTVTLELALHRCPTVVSYKLTLLNRLIAKYVMKLQLPHYCIVNLLKGETVFPELIAAGLSAQKLFRELSPLIEETPERRHCIEQCQQISEILTEEHASVSAAKAIADLLP